MNHTILTLDPKSCEIEEDDTYIEAYFELPEEWKDQYIKIHSIQYKLKNKYINANITNQKSYLSLYPYIYKLLGYSNTLDEPIFIFSHSYKFWLSSIFNINYKEFMDSECNIAWEYSDEQKYTFAHYTMNCGYSNEESNRFFYGPSICFFSEKLSKEKISFIGNKNKNNMYTLDDYPKDEISINYISPQCINFLSFDFIMKYAFEPKEFYITF